MTKMEDFGYKREKESFPEVSKTERARQREIQKLEELERIQVEKLAKIERIRALKREKLKAIEENVTGHIVLFQEESLAKIDPEEEISSIIETPTNSFTDPLALDVDVDDKPPSSCNYLPERKHPEIKTYVYKTKDSEFIFNPKKSVSFPSQISDPKNLVNKPHPPEKGKEAVYLEKIKQEKHERIKAKKLAKIERIRDSLFKLKQEKHERVEKMKQEKHERIKAKKLAKIDKVRDSLFKTGALKVISNQSKANSTAADPKFNVVSENATSPFQNSDSEHKMIDSSFKVVDTKLTFDEGNPDSSSTVIEPETESRCPVPEMIDHNYAISHSSLLCKMF